MSLQTAVSQCLSMYLKRMGGADSSQGLGWRERTAMCNHGGLEKPGASCWLVSELLKRKRVGVSVLTPESELPGPASGSQSHPWQRLFQGKSINPVQNTSISLSIPNTELREDSPSIVSELIAFENYWFLLTNFYLLNIGYQASESLIFLATSGDIHNYSWAKGFVTLGEQRPFLFLRQGLTIQL